MIKKDNFFVLVACMHVFQNSYDLSLWAVFLKIGALVMQYTNAFLYLNIEIDHCSPNPCDNGECENTPVGFVCHCANGYTGDICDEGSGGGCLIVSYKIMLQAGIVM